MFIYIDESGNFMLPTDGKSRVSCVAALIIPGSVQNMVFADFLRLKRKWGDESAEYKGSKLDEAQVAEVIRILSAYELFVKVHGIDMGRHTKEGVAQHQRQQASSLTKNLTPEHHPNLVREVHECKAMMEAAPPQLYVQFTVATTLMRDVIQATVIHYGMKKPLELGRFRWVIDGKDTSRTRLEELWEKLIPAFLAVNYSLIMVEGADYSAFDRFTYRCPEPPYHIRMTGKQIEGEYEGPDVRMICREDLSYCQSCTSLGLQLVDIVASTFQRAMNGKLQHPGWDRLGRLFLTNEKGSHAAPYLVLESDASSPLTGEVSDAIKRHRGVLHRIDLLARNIV
jgi:hypothetical protein